MPRYYTIASSSMKHPEDIRIAISLTTNDTSEGKQWMGFASQYLDQLFTNFKQNTDGSYKPMCNVFVKDSFFLIPKEMSTPLVMVGPGTGVVPFIGIIEDREYLKS